MEESFRQFKARWVLWKTENHKRRVAFEIELVEGRFARLHRVGLV